MDWIAYALSLLERIFGWAAALALLGSLILLELHLVHDEHLIALMFGVVLVALLEAARRTRRAAEKSASIAAHTSNEVSAQVSALSKQIVNKLYSLDDCVRDVSSRLSKVRRGDRVVIHHLGLDMSQAWEKVEALLKNHPNVKKLDYEILMISDDLSGTHPLPAEAKAWAGHAGESIGMIRNGLRSLSGYLKAEERTVHLQVKQYKSVPVVHGLYLAEPKELAAHYISFCRWDPPFFRWGADAYFLVDKANARLDPIQDDLVKIYEGYYAALWDEAKEYTVEEQVGSALMETESRVKSPRIKRQGG